MADQENGTNGNDVKYSVKELIARLDGKMDVFVQGLNSKAERVAVHALSTRVATLELSEARRTSAEQTRDRFSAKQITVAGLFVTLLATVSSLPWLIHG